MSVIVRLVIFIKWRHKLLVTVTRESKVWSEKEIFRLNLISSPFYETSPMRSKSAINSKGIICLSNTTMSALNTTEKQLLRIAAFECCWLAGNAIAEATRMKKTDLYREILSNYLSVVNTLDFDELATRCVLSPIRESLLVHSRQVMQQHAKEGNTFV